MVDEHAFAAGGAQLGLLRFGVLLSLRDAGVPDFVCHAENGTTEVLAGLGFGRGFRRINPRRVEPLVVDVAVPAENDRFRQLSRKAEA
ncbi:hypothetical protein JM654_00585 [Microbacterium oxydans]|nr:hypothetical protein [Microbacterium oxydans]